MNRKIILISAIVTISLLTGCMPKSTQMAIDNVKKTRARIKAEANLQDTPPNIEKLKTYAGSPRSKYFANLLALSYKDYALIPCKLVDPKTDKKAKAIDDEDWADAKIGLIRMGETMNFSKSIVNQMIRNHKKTFNKPFCIMTDLPEGASRGVIRDGDNATLDMQNAKHTKHIYINFSFKDESDKKRVFNSIVKDLDQFFTKDSGWKKVNTKEARPFKNQVEDWKSIIAQQKQLLSEKGDSPQEQLEKEVIKAKIKSYEDMLANSKKCLKTAQKTDIVQEQIVYRYMYAKTPNITDVHMVSVLMKPTTVQVYINRVVH